MATSDARAKVIGLLDKLRESEEKRRQEVDALLDEIEAIAGGAETIGQKLRWLRGYIGTAWQDRWRKPMDYRDTENAASLKRWIVKQKITKEEIADRWSRYLQSTDPYYVERRHPFGLFVRDFNSFVGLPLVSAPDTSAASQTAEKMRGLRGE